MGTHDHLRKGFLERERMPAWAGALALRAPPLLVAALLSFVPALGLFAFAALGPERFREALTEPEKVSDAFRSFISGVATASSIAVSLAALTLRRDLKGIQSHEERQETTDVYRRNLRDRLGARELPIRIGPLMAETLDGVAERARMLVDRNPATTPAIESEGTSLRAVLEILDERASLTAARLRATGDDPDRLHLVTLDLEQEVMTRLLHRAARDERLPEADRNALAEIRDLYTDYILAQKFLTTLVTEWNLRRMSAAILVSTLPGIVTASVMALTYGQGAVGTLGARGAALLVSIALGVVIFPLACFVSYVLRFLLLNQQTIPAAGFLLGPEGRLHAR